jgi:hypothetical protein
VKPGDLVLVEFAGRERLGRIHAINARSRRALHRCRIANGVGGWLKQTYYATVKGPANLATLSPADLASARQLDLPLPDVAETE